MTIPFPVFTNQGWTCPKCGCVYAPWVYTCAACAPVKSITISTTPFVPYVPPGGSGGVSGSAP